MDGAHSEHVLRHIIPRLAGRRIAVVTVFDSVFVWNDYFGPLILIQKPEMFTIQLAVGNFSKFYATRGQVAVLT
jgi:ABC-type glycerol-3-phosphate transport system permease component